MINNGLYILLLAYCSGLFAQSGNDSIALHFHLEFNKLPLETGKQYISAKKDSLTIETFKCYISDIRIGYSDNTASVEEDSYHLLDLQDASSFYIPIAYKSDKMISQIRFKIGIDSLTNTSGALGGALDPLNGMYWAWQSGYINTKIEGESSSCKTRRNEFQFHIGGYLQPYYTMREMTFATSIKANTDIPIGINLNSFFSDLELETSNSVMIPCSEAMQLANHLTKMFYVR